MNRFLIAVLLFVFGPRCLAQETSNPGLRAGASKVEISPDLGAKIVGNWSSPPATKIHDPLHARCLILDDGVTKIGFVICDNVGIPKEVFDAARSYIGSSGSIDPDHLLMASTHTHSGTSARDTTWVNGVATLSDYQRRVARGIGDSVTMALNKMQPAKIGWASVAEPSEVFNRRWFVSDPKLRTNPFGGVDQVRMNPPRQHPSLVRQAGPVDPEVFFLSVRAIDGTPLALLANYSLHYVGGVPTGEISADYFAAFANKIATKLDANADFVGIMTNGTSGDVNNVDFSSEKPSHQPYEKIAIVAENVASKVSAAEATVTYRERVTLQTENMSLALRVRKPDQSIKNYFDKIKNATGKRPVYHRNEDAYAERIADLDSRPDEVSIDLQAFAIDELGIATSPFETFAETGLEIKRRSPMTDTFVIELANGAEGYLPTPTQHELGGYETWMGTSRVQTDASVLLTDALLNLLKGLKP